ncbi:branched-chain amino acid ABC transporter permease [Haloterrigena salifodinae]|uniref:Branched-chain amino acid ABC transporter permease n=1 Tax=Haloterrigena salifodinae TaxID=2675099 RepID=A0A8T8E1V6_9EURY|nr:branched-chain amino acid ABC transporter permease [Haloterrigena salifodinae]QRV15739.1 branched-chain amino acid ABC transporter permease [Haloterrigena salifodinae]
MSERVRRIGRLRSTVRQTILLPSRRAAARVLSPIDRVLQPGANLFNRFLGSYVGEVTGLQLGLLVAALVALATVPMWAPLFVGNYMRTLAVACIWSIFAMGWDIQSGYTGYISFGHSALSAAAGYTTALLAVNLSPVPSFWVTIPVSILAALVLGLLIGLPSLRLSGPYFSLVTFVAVLLFYRLTIGFSETLGGENGFQAVEVFTWDFTERYYLMLVPMLLVAAALTVVARSNVGTVLVAIRENERAVSAAGLDPTKFKLWSFALSSITMGIGGVLLAHFGGNVDPTTFVVVDRSIEMIAMAVIGGMSSVLGPIGGAFLFVLLRDEILRLWFGHSTRWVMLWLLVLLVLVFARNGLFRWIWHAVGAVGGDRK